MDKNYWNNYYQQHGKDKNINMCSTFAQFCLPFFAENQLDIIELGSGNGRDAIYFAHNKLNVFAIDQSTTAIDLEKQNIDPDIMQFLHPLALDFVQEDYQNYKNIGVFYSRFTLHSITKNEELELLPKIYNALNQGGIFCIEARTIKDPLCGVGKLAGDNTYITDHARRFIDSQVFLSQVLSLGFKLLYFRESDNLSIYKDDNPVLMRIILQK